MDKLRKLTHDEVIHLFESGEQSIFDYIVNHLRLQRKPATNVDGCVYRAGNGLMCAVGCVVPRGLDADTLLANTMNHDTGLTSLIDVIMTKFSPKTKNGKIAELYNQNHELLDRLQQIHDSADVSPCEEHTLESWGNDLEVLATDRKLIFNKEQWLNGVNHD